MRSPEERVAYLEGHVNEQSHSMLEVRDAVRTLEARMDARFEGVEHRIDRLDDRVSRQFVWLVGIQVTTLVAIVTALVARG